jgi:flagellar biosynthesis/type III secretory pathway chaperone
MEIEKGEDVMSNSISELISVLSEKRGTMEELLRLLEEEQRCIVKLDLPNLEAQVEKKKQLLVDLETSNNLCRQLVKQAALELDLPEAASLSPLLPKVALPQRDTLKGLQNRLLELGTALDRLLAFNGELLQGSLRTVNRSLGFFGNLFSRSKTYGEAGCMVKGTTDIRLVCKEI